MKGIRFRLLMGFSSTQSFRSSIERGNNKVGSNAQDQEIISCHIHHNPLSCKEQERTTDEEFEQRLKSKKGHILPYDHGAPTRDVIDDGGSCIAPAPHEKDTLLDDDDEEEEGQSHKNFVGSRPSPETQFYSSFHTMKKKTTEEKEEDGKLLVDYLGSKSPPGGRDSLILYTTSLRGIRKTFEDCCSIKFLLDSFNVLYYERDISMHLEYREELWRILGGKVIPPRLFIRGRLIGGADKVIELHEHGKLRNLLQGIPLDLSKRKKCKGCGGVSFVLCSECNGSRKVFNGEGRSGEVFSRCPRCNENGLIKCPLCC